MKDIFTNAVASQGVARGVGPAPESPICQLDFEPSSSVKIDTPSTLKSLGSKKTEYIEDYTPSLLEKFPNPQLNFAYKIDIVAPEVTSLCPITAQPDFAVFKISYSPKNWCVESKSLKLYLFSFRSAKMFHEAMTNTIAQDLYAMLHPHWIEVKGEFTPRGGITFWPTVRFEEPKID